MRRHLAYARYVVKHKWLVFWAARRLGVSLWRAVLHDLSKLRPSEWRPYARTFYNEDGSKALYAETPEFNLAWCQHQKRNDHHWQAFLLTMDRGTTEPLPMSEAAVREMVADWVGASIAITGANGVRAWYGLAGSKMILHPTTRLLVELLMERAEGIGNRGEWWAPIPPRKD